MTSLIRRQWIMEVHGVFLIMDQCVFEVLLLALFKHTSEMRT